MSQADKPFTTSTQTSRSPATPLSDKKCMSRRAIMYGAVAISAAPVTMLHAESSPPDAVVFDLEQKLHKAWASLDTACSELGRAEEIVFAWKARNPCPKIRECTVGTNAEYAIWAKQVAEAKNPSEITAIDPNADLRAAIKEHGEAVSHWEISKNEVARSAGLDRAKEKETIANDEVQNVIEDLVDAHASTIEGLLSKARVADKDDEIAHSIVADLLEMYPAEAGHKAPTPRLVR